MLGPPLHDAGNHRVTQARFQMLLPEFPAQEVQSFYGRRHQAGVGNLMFAA